MAGEQPKPRFPWGATLLVAAAAGFMVHLGFWQLDRLHQKEAMINRYAAALSQPADVGFELNKIQLIDYPEPYYHAHVNCYAVGEIEQMAGRNSTGQTGWAHLAHCLYRNGRGRMGAARIVIGWSRDLQPVHWAGGDATGIIVPETRDLLKWHIVADPPLVGLQPNARPDPRNLPNNHLSYAVQWFLFAATAVVIYGLALRKRLKG